MRFNISTENSSFSDVKVYRILAEESCHGSENETASDSSLYYFQVTYFVVDILLALLAIVGNVMIIVAYISNRRLRIISHYHLMSLAVSDLLMGSVTIPIWLAAAFQGLPHSRLSCLLALSMVLFVDLASVFSLLSMTVDRYLFISRPLFYDANITSRKTIWWIISSWVVAGIFILPMPFTWRWQGQANCNFTTDVNIKYLLFIFISSILLPIVGMTAMYIHIFIIVRQKIREDRVMYSVRRRLKKSSLEQVILTKDDVSMNESKNRADRSLKSIFKRRKHSELQTALFFAFLLLFFVVTWVPMFALDIFVHMYAGTPVSQTALNVAVLLSHCNSSFNPFLYKFRSDFDQTIMQWVCEKKRNAHITDMTEDL
ncbi:adenosine receptor A3-like [Amphiura filiformis]|uniref:adenosine receptor A3-like n=1 Tax=Amphiura filiformis TaxID=82378 RepID=UPI003B20C482